MTQDGNAPVKSGECNVTKGLKKTRRRSTSMTQDGNAPVKSGENKLVSALKAIEAQLHIEPTSEAEESREAEEEASKTTSPEETDLFAAVCAALDVDSVSQVFSEYATEEQKLALMCLIGVPSFAVFAIVNELYHDDG